MNRYYEYLRFFCNTPLAKNDKLQFLEDRGFAITTAQGVVSLYSAKAELIATYENACVLNNGCVCVKKLDCIDVYYDGKPLPSIPFDTATELRIIRFLTNAVVIAEGKNAKETVYFVRPNCVAYRFCCIPTECHVEATSADGMVLTTKKDMFRQDEKVLHDQNGTRLNLPPFYRVDFLPCGSYIVHFNTIGVCNITREGCALYNAKHERLLHHDQSCYILQLGDKVKYDNSLIIDPKDGRIISKYKGENEVYSGLHIFKHEITGGSYPRLWIGDNMKAVMKDGNLLALYYWKDGYIYFAPQCFCNIDDDIAMSRHVSELYRMRIKEIMP